MWEIDESINPLRFYCFFLHFTLKGWIGTFPQRAGWAQLKPPSSYSLNKLKISREGGLVFHIVNLTQSKKQINAKLHILDFNFIQNKREGCIGAQEDTLWDSAKIVQVLMAWLFNRDFNITTKPLNLKSKRSKLLKITIFYIKFV